MDLSLYSSYLVLFLVTVATIGLVKLISAMLYHNSYWKNKRVPYKWTTGGIAMKVLFRLQSFPDYCQKIYKSFPNARYFGIMDFGTPIVVLRDPELIKEVTVKNFEHFTDHRTFVDEKVDPIFGKNIFLLRGERWKEMRNTLSPSFTASKMRFMFDLVSQCSHEFVNYFVEHPEECLMVETKDAFTRYTNDVIASTSFGISVNSMKDKKNEFYVKGIDATSFSSFLQTLKFFLFRLSPRLTRLLRISLLSKSTTQFFRNIVSETVQIREEKKVIRPDMIHLLMQARDKEKSEGHQMTIDDIVAQAFIFFLAGFDTASTLMCFMIHELMLNPDIQEKLREEVDRFMAEGNGEITYEILSKMEYMEMVMNETLRKYPPVIFIDRVCVKDFQLPPSTPDSKEYDVPPGVTIWLPAYAIQHDPKYFPNPEKFDPERFNEENKDKIIPYTYMPFGLGPRKCIGNRFALMETKILVAHLLHKFVFKRTEKTSDTIVFSKPSFNLRLQGGFWVRLEKRSS